MTQVLFDQDRCQMICLLGTNGAGKTSSLKVLKTDDLSATQSTPVVNFESYTWKTSSNQPNHLRIWDCSGFTEIRSLAHLHIKRSKGILVFYNSNLRKTFDDLTMWIDLALSQKILLERIWIVRTEFKCDDSQQKEESQYVSQQQGLMFSEKAGVQHRSLKHYKIQNVKQIYEQFGNRIIRDHLDSYICHNLIRRTISYIDKIPLPESNIETYAYFGIGSLLLGLVVLGAIKNR